MVAGLLVGTYAEAGGPGLVPLVPAADGWAAGDPMPHIRNASFGVRSRRHALWYFVDEQDGRLGVYDAENFGLRAEVDTGGEAPCHLALDPSDRFLAIANYQSGSVSLLRLDEGGLPAGPPDVHRNEGQGPDLDRQDHAHAHWTGFIDGGARLLCVDLGADRVITLKIEPDGRIGSPRSAFSAPPGSGPRHLALHPSAQLAFLVSELASTLTVLRCEPSEQLTALQTLSTLPAGADGQSLGGAIALNRSADRLYVSNRGHDSVATFALQQRGTASLLQHMPSGGASPRFVLLLEDRRELLVAHEESGGVAIFKIDTDGSLAADPVTIDISGAAFIAAVQESGASQ